MSVLVLGHGEHGKDTFAEMLAKKQELKFSSSSAAAFEVILPVLLTIYPPTYPPEEIYADRRNQRELWRRLILLYNTPDRSALARHILKDNDMYVGMRSAEEFRASKHLFDKIYWVDARHRVGKVDESMGIRYTSDMIWVNNNGSVSELEHKVERMCG